MTNGERALRAELREMTARFERVIDAHAEGAWMARALGAEEDRGDWQRVAQAFVAMFDPRPGDVTPASFWAVAEGVKIANADLRKRLTEANHEIELVTGEKALPALAKGAVR